jgi:hypothetical protein
MNNFNRYLKPLADNDGEEFGWILRNLVHDSDLGEAITLAAIMRSNLTLPQGLAFCFRPLRRHAVTSMDRNQNIFTRADVETRRMNQLEFESGLGGSFSFLYTVRLGLFVNCSGSYITMQ